MEEGKRERDGGRKGGRDRGRGWGRVKWVGGERE